MLVVVYNNLIPSSLSVSDAEEHLVVHRTCSYRDLSGQSVDSGCDSDHPVQHDTNQGENQTQTAVT